MSRRPLHVRVLRWPVLERRLYDDGRLVLPSKGGLIRTRVPTVSLRLRVINIAPPYMSIEFPGGNIRDFRLTNGQALSERMRDWLIDPDDLAALRPTKEK